MESHRLAIGVHRRAPHSFLLPDRILCDVHHILEREQSVLPPSSRRTRLPEEVPSRRPQTSNRMEKSHEDESCCYCYRLDHGRHLCSCKLRREWLFVERPSLERRPG